MVLPADWVPGPEQGSWTYDDYASLPDDGQRYEIVNGVLVMAPAPDGPHQDAVLRIAHYLLVHIEFAGLGKVRVAPFDVELSSKNVFQPDVFIVLNAHLSRMQKKKMIGAPDLVVEVLSESTARLDREIKPKQYALYGVPEYWLIDPVGRTVEIFRVREGAYELAAALAYHDKLESPLFPGLTLPVSSLWES